MVRGLREQRRMSLTELSELMGQVDRPLLPSGLSKIEQGERRVDVDDLVALATCFGVTPSDLLGAYGAGEWTRPTELTVDAAARLLGTDSSEIRSVSPIDDDGVLILMTGGRSVYYDGWQLVRVAGSAMDITQARVVNGPAIDEAQRRHRQPLPPIIKGGLRASRREALEAQGALPEDDGTPDTNQPDESAGATLGELGFRNLQNLESIIAKVIEEKLAPYDLVLREKQEEAEDES